MRKVTLKNKLLIASMMAALGFTTEAMAHNEAGSLGEAADATDFYQVRCTTDSGGTTGKLWISILDPTPTQGGGKESVVGQVVDQSKVTQGGFIQTASDPVRVHWVDANGNLISIGDIYKGVEGAHPIPDTEYGPETYLWGGNGAYTLAVHKLKAGTKNYVLQYHCLTANDLHTGTTIILLQDQ